MKKKYFLCALSCVCMFSCSVLDKKPLDIISDADVWNDKGLISLYVNNLYASTPVFTNDAFASAWHNDVDVTGMFYVNELSDEAYVGWGFWNKGTIISYKGGNLKDDGGLMEYWEQAYKVIRKVNVLLEKMGNTILEHDVAMELCAEARFIRAFNYFAMVKRYGGVPLITKVQQMDDSEEELYPVRNSEKEIYDFICNEMEEIVEFLPEKAAAGKVTKYAALALKSRVALYAGSIAQYGKKDLNGLLGFDANEANMYYEKSYEASKQIINSGAFSLYNANPDKSANFRNLFLDEGNNECIFVKRYDGNTGGGVCWGYDFAQCPKPQAWGAGNQDAPYLEMVESFERVDGSSGKFDYKELESKIWTMDELWGDRDPRFKATIWTEGTPWKGSTIGFYKGLIDEDGNVHLDEGSYKGMSVYGSQTIGNGNFFTSFGVMKYLDETSDNLGREMSYSKTDYIVFRLGEMYLNLAEAAYELGKSDEALTAINTIRQRVGMPKKDVVNTEIIRNERKIELAFEGHRYWDLRRWRIAEKLLTGGNSGLHYYRVYPDAPDGTSRFKIKVLDNVEVEVGGTKPVFRSHYYYLPITKERIAKNGNLIENPGY